MSSGRDRRELEAPRRLPAQLDLHGNAHELAPTCERLRLFEPAPAQLRGQTFLELDEPGDER
jgi:hypothetical protein